MTSDGWVDRTAYPFRSRWLEVDGGRMHYVDEGIGAGSSTDALSAAGTNTATDTGTDTATNTATGSGTDTATDAATDTATDTDTDTDTDAGTATDRAPPAPAPVLVLVHGTPVWSFVWRHLIADLARDHRVIAMDHIGFGLSDRPAAWGYTPADHARNVARLVGSLGVDRYVLVAHDFGGPIGLAGALADPAAVRGLVLFNTWLWGTAGTPAERISRFMAGSVGRFLYKRLNVSPRLLVRMAFGDRRKLTPAVHRQYIDVFPTRASRHAPWVLARELLASSDWYESLWQRREAIAGHPALLLWGMKDPAFKPDALARWQGALRDARTVEFPDAGHFVQEEAPAEAAAAIRSFVAGLG